jgi:ribosomal protein L29
LWAAHQADALRRRASNELDWENVAEEIQDVAKSEQREIESRLAVLCAHLLQWRFQSKRRSRSWRGSIAEARNQIARVTRDSPSLRSYPHKVLAEAYAAARRVAEAETGLTKLPAECPWSAEQLLQHDFWPEPERC